MKVSVSILKEHDNISEVMKKINSSICDYVHIDVMDGIFVDNVKFPLSKVEEVKSLASKPIDLHLMVKDHDQIKQYLAIRPYFFTFHVEVINDDSLINIVKDNKIKVGLAINPETDVKKLFPYLDKIDLVLIMSVNPGYGGQSFIKDVLEKVRIIKDINPNLIVNIDGGVNDMTAPLCIDAGCDMVVSGSYITNSNNYDENIKKIKEL